jgi:transposase
MLADHADQVLGVDTHRDSHSVAILAADTAIVQGQITIAANERGYRRLLRYAKEHAPDRRAWAIEGTGSYGAGLATFLYAQGEMVLEADRPRRPARRDRAKSDELDAIRAAREALTREHLARPRQRGEREALRVLLATRDSAVRSKRAAISLLKGLLVSAPASLREGLRSLSTRDQITRAARLRVSSTLNSEQRATIIALRASARRTLALEDEANDLQREIEPIVASIAPELLQEMGVGPIVAAQIICAYSHNGRIRSEAAFAALAGTAPLPASSGQTVRHRLNRSGDRDLNRALHTIVLCRMRDDPHTRAYTARRQAEGRSTREISGASSATPPDTSIAYSTPPSQISQIAKLDKHRSIGQAIAVRLLCRSGTTAEPSPARATIRACKTLTQSTLPPLG